MATIINSLSGSFNSCLSSGAGQQLTKTEQLVKITILGTAFIGAVYGCIRLKNEGAINDIIFTPVYEEILFRGFIPAVADVALNIIKGKPRSQADFEARKTARAVVSAAIFGAMHHEFPVQKFWFLGRALGYVKEETGGYLLPLALHMTHNVTSIFLEEEMIKHGVLFPVAMALDTGALWMVGKTINPIRSLKETYTYFTSK